MCGFARFHSQSAHERVHAPVYDACCLSESMSDARFSFSDSQRLKTHAGGHHARRGPCALRSSGAILFYIQSHELAWSSSRTVASCEGRNADNHSMVRMAENFSSRPEMDRSGRKVSAIRETLPSSLSDRAFQKPPSRSAKQPTR